MSVDGWNTVLVLGGIQSGRFEFATSLVSDRATVRWVTVGQERATPADRQQPPSWTVEETDGDPTRLIELIANAGSDETLLVDDLGGWIDTLVEQQPSERRALIDRLAAAVRDCPARLVLVSPEAGLTPAAAVPVATRAFVDALGATNQAVAQVSDAVALIVAGRPLWLGSPPPGQAPAERAPGVQPDTAQPVAPGPAVSAPGTVTDPWTAPTKALPIVTTGPAIQPNMQLPLPDEDATAKALALLGTRDFAGAGLGALERVVGFAAGTQGNPVPVPWRSPRVLLLHGDHEGGVAAGTTPGESTRRADQARAGEGVLARLAAEAGASLRVVPTPTAAPIEHGPALSLADVESALSYGWRLAEEAVDEGVDVLVLAACGAGTDAAAAAVLAATSGAEPAAVLPRVTVPGGTFDDAAWMTRCAAVRDALHRTRRSPRGAKDVLAELGGGDIAVATGILLGATARRTPVLLDGPVGVAAGLVSRGLAGQARHWCLLPDHGGHPAVRHAADVLGLTPVFDLKLDVGEGAISLAALPMLRTALTLAATTPTHPVLASAAQAEPEPADAAFIEPEPAGPGPTTTGQTEAGTTPADPSGA